tara:strand:- start:1323 stop:2012 length:690 start_codon:yes stop_codon:yes gene_type:complete
MYYGSPYMGDCSCCDCECNCCGCCKNNKCCKILSCYYLFKKLLFFVPQIPNNRKGGIIGYLIGTHPCKTRYYGGIRWKDIITGTYREQDISNNEQIENYRTSVLYSNNNIPCTIKINRDNYTTFNNSLEDPLLNEINIIDNINGISILSRPNTLLYDDDLIGDSLTDYKNKECSLCFDTNVQQFIVFECGHGCCYKCGLQIIDQKMPCPWCRHHFTSIKIGYMHNLDIV